MKANGRLKGAIPLLRCQKFYKKEVKNMEQKIKVISGNKTEGQCEILNKLKAEQRILELFETEQIEKIEITYKTKESACTKPTQNI